MTSLGRFVYYTNQIHWFSSFSCHQLKSKENNQIYGAAFLIRHLCTKHFYIQDVDTGKIENDLCSLRLWLIKLAILLSFAWAAGEFNCLN